MIRETRTMRAVALTALAAGLATAAPAAEWERADPAEAGFLPEGLERLGTVMQGYVEDGDVPGMVILIAKDGQVVYHEAFGQMELGVDRPMTPDAVFRIASQTKAIVSAGIMILQEEGRLLVDDPLGEHLPEWSETTVAAGDGTEPAERPITIRDLLTHSSGIPYGAWINPTNAGAWAEAGFDGWYLAGRDVPIRDLVRDMAALPMAEQPGEGFLYGYNTDILGAVIEEVSGQPLDAFLEERILGPLEMDDTSFWIAPEEAERLPVVYDRPVPGELTEAPDGSGMWHQGDYVEGEGPNVTLSGGAGLLSTAEDYAAFLEMVRRGGTDRDGDRIMSPMSAELMTTDHLIEGESGPGAGFGYGFAVVTDAGDRGIPGNEGEFNWGGAYHSTYWVDPAEDLVVTYFTQMGDVGSLDDHGVLRAMVYQAIAE